MIFQGRTIAPMKAAAGDVPTGDGWVYEFKWDGMRIVSFIEDGEIRLQSTNLLDVTVSFPELDALPSTLIEFESLVLDGEVVAFDEHGLPSFSQLQQRMHIKNPADAARRAALIPVVYVIFDVLHVNGQDTFSLPWDDRRRLLEQIVEPGPNWRLADVHKVADALLDVVRAQGLEGIVAKQLRSRYVPGKRSANWRKIKPRGRQELVVGGWVTGEGSRAGKIGALDVGYYEGDQLRYAGRVGSGLTDREIGRLLKLLAPLVVEESPFADPVPRANTGRMRTWIKPELVVEVAFGEWSPAGQLRHPSYLGYRSDKMAGDVVRE